MQVTFEPDDASDPVVLCDYGQEENSGLGGFFEDLVEQIGQWQAPDAGQLHRGQRMGSVRFGSARTHESYAAAEAFLLELLRDFPRTTGDVVCEASSDGGSTVLATITFTDATVQLIDFRQVGITTLLTWSVRGALVEPSS